MTFFDIASAHDHVRGTRFERIRYVTETESTNDDAQALLGEPGCGGLVILAEHQRAGKGRRSREWIAAAGSSLLFTAVLPETLPSTALWAVPFWAGLAVAEGIEQAARLRPTLQWPNDLLLRGRKCCGILAVSRITGDRAWVGCGVGLNVRRADENAETAQIRPLPAFLEDEGVTIARETLLAAILHAFDARLELLQTPMSVARAWETRAALPGTPYRIQTDAGETFEGQALRLEDDGSLILRTANQERRVTMADARVLRNADLRNASGA